MEVVELPALEVVPISDPELRNGIASPKIDGSMEIMEDTIFAKQLVIGARSWIHNLVWTADDYNTASWSAGTLKLADGSTYAIAAGNTGNIAATTYIYLDPEVSLTVLQTTTIYSNAIGERRILLAIVAAAADTAAKALISAFGSEGTTISGNKIVTGKIQSTDGNTYFDLDTKRIVIHDGTTNRGVFGTV